MTLHLKHDAGLGLMSWFAPDDEDLPSEFAWGSGESREQGRLHSLTGRVGTSFYMSPEVAMGWARYNSKVDLYRCAAVQSMICSRLCQIGLVDSLRATKWRLTVLPMYFAVGKGYSSRQHWFKCVQS